MNEGIGISRTYLLKYSTFTMSSPEGGADHTGHCLREKQAPGLSTEPQRHSLGCSRKSLTGVRSPLLLSIVDASGMGMLQERKDWSKQDLGEDVKRPGSGSVFHSKDPRF